MAKGFTNTFGLPPPLNIIKGNVPENFKELRRQVEIYLEACGASDKPDMTKNCNYITMCRPTSVRDI